MTAIISWEDDVLDILMFKSAVSRSENCMRPSRYYYSMQSRQARKKNCFHALQGAHFDTCRSHAVSFLASSNPTRCALGRLKSMHDERVPRESHVLSHPDPGRQAGKFSTHQSMKNFRELWQRKPGMGIQPMSSFK